MPASCSKNTEKIEVAIGYTFKDKALLLTALTHSSYANEHVNEGVQDNERLEFLGDAVLGLVVAEELYRVSGDLSESEMARYKAFLVSKTVLAELARKLQIGDALRLGRGEEVTGGKQKETILADAMEAIFGAVFLEGGYRKAKSTILRLLGEEIKRAVKEGIQYDFKTALQEFTQRHFGLLPEYRTVQEKGKDHDKMFTVEVLVAGEVFGRGIGKSKKEAQMKAAEEALSGLQKRI